MPRQKMHPTDNLVGKRVRLRRSELGVSQEELGKFLGITFQQIQKYERGINRIGASVLSDIARRLDVGISYFFEEENATIPVDKYSIVYFRTVRALQKIKCVKRQHNVCETAELYAEMQQ